MPSTSSHVLDLHSAISSGLRRKIHVASEERACEVAVVEPTFVSEPTSSPVHVGSIVECFCRSRSKCHPRFTSCGVLTDMCRVGPGRGLYTRHASSCERPFEQLKEQVAVVSVRHNSCTRYVGCIQKMVFEVAERIIPPTPVRGTATR